MEPRNRYVVPRLTNWESLTIGFPKPRHTRVYRLPQAVSLLWTATLFLLLTTVCSVSTGGIIATGLCALLALYFGKLHRIARQCWNVERAALLTGQTQRAVEQAILERGIAPSFIVDDVPVYHPSQLIESTLLLRPASQSCDVALLRAASGQGSGSAMLVRPTGNAPLPRPAMQESEQDQLEQRT